MFSLVLQLLRFQAIGLSRRDAVHTYCKVSNGGVIATSHGSRCARVSIVYYGHGRGTPEVKVLPPTSSGDYKLQS